MTTSRSTARLAAGTTVVARSGNRECAAKVLGQTGCLTVLRMLEGPCAGKVREYPTSMVRIPAAFEAI